MQRRNDRRIYGAGVKLLCHIFLYKDSWKDELFDSHIEFRKYFILNNDHGSVICIIEI